MKAYPISSINIEFCGNTKQKVLSKIKSCHFCKEIPIPFYRTSKDQNLYFCKACYEKKEFHIKDGFLIFPSEMEIELLSKLIINCRNFTQGCAALFNINSLDALIQHQKICCLREENSSFLKNQYLNLKTSNQGVINTCRRCGIVENKKGHDCLTSLKKHFEKIIQKQTLRLDEIEHRLGDSKSNLKKNNFEKAEILTEKIHHFEILQDKNHLSNINISSISVQNIFSDFNSESVHEKKEEKSDENLLSLEIVEREKKLNKSLNKLRKPGNLISENFENVFQPILKLVPEEFEIVERIENIQKFEQEIGKFNYMEYLDLNLSQEKLLESDITLISTNLPKLSNLTHLSISLNTTNKIGSSGLSSLSKGISFLKKLSSLSLGLKANKLCDIGVEELSKAIVKNHNLTKLSLDFESNQLGVRSGNAMAGMLNVLEGLTEISTNLGSTTLGGSGSAVIFNSLKNLRKLHNLTMSLKSTSIGEIGANGILNFLNDSKVLRDLHLNLKNSNLNKIWLTNIAKTCKEKLNSEGGSIKSLKLEVGSPNLSKNDEEILKGLLKEKIIF